MVFYLVGSSDPLWVPPIWGLTGFFPGKFFGEKIGVFKGGINPLGDLFFGEGIPTVFVGAIGRFSRWEIFNTHGSD